MDTFVLGYVLFIATQFVREFIYRKGIEARSLHLGKYDNWSTVFTASYIIITCTLPIIFRVYNVGFTYEYQKIGIFGIIIMILGMIIHFLAVQTLGKFFTRTLCITSKHSLIRKGIYHKIRHPGYLGTILIGIGFSIAAYNWLLFVLILILLILIYSYRIHVEEKMLLNQFGKEYKEYIKDSWILIPYIL